jgi:hypothetical protein
MLASETHRATICGVSLYVPQLGGSQEEVKRLVPYASNKRLELLSVCDANSHHEVWGITDVNRRGECLLDFIMRSKLSIVEEENQTSWTQEDRKC